MTSGGHGSVATTLLMKQHGYEDYSNIDYVTYENNIFVLKICTLHDIKTLNEREISCFGLVVVAIVVVD